MLCWMAVQKKILMDLTQNMECISGERIYLEKNSRIFPTQILKGATGTKFASALLTAFYVSVTPLI